MNNIHNAASMFVKVALSIESINSILHSSYDDENKIKILKQFVADLDSKIPKIFKEPQLTE